jgi:hypothetical protein
MPQGARMGLPARTPVGNLAVDLGSPALLFSAFVLLVPLAARPGRPSGLLVLRPRRTSVNNRGGAKGPPELGAPPAGETPLREERPHPAPPTAEPEANRGQVPT